MSRDIAESDWKIFKQLHPVALDRFFKKAVADIRPLLDAKEISAKDQFWDAFDLAKKRREEAAELFDDLRRSTAMLMIAALAAHKLITDQEMAKFSPDLRESVRSYLGIAGK